MKDTYITTFLSHLISRGDFEAICAGANRVMGMAWHKKRSNDIVKTPSFVSNMAVLSVVLVFMYMFFIYMSTTNNSPAMLIVSLVCVGIGSAIAIGLSIYNYYRSIKKFVAIQHFIRKELEDYYNKENIKYAGKLKFVIWDNYIECNILQTVDSAHRRNQVINNIPSNANIELINTEAGLMD
jgi:hypothetical protein